MPHRIPVYIFGGLLVAGALVAQPTNCTIDNVVGTYALAYQGTVMVPASGSQPSAVLAAGLGLLSINWQGTISGPAYATMGGKLSTSTMAGTMRVNSDCTGSIDWGAGSTATFVIIDQGNELNSMMLTAGGMGPVIYGTWKKISRATPQCSQDVVHGTYAFRHSGTTIMTPTGASQPTPVPGTTLGAGSAGYDGSMVASGTTAVGGQVMQFNTANGKVVVNSDCTLTLSATIQVGGTAVGKTAWWGVALNFGNEIWGIQTQDPSGGSPVVLGTWRRIAAMPQ